ncbi:MAG: hypothetical protein ACE3JU_17195 [Paenibacillus sp.]|uniref:hypothetical protein n=1 Tax=Paenibacillus sp. TaxID=58172 RepID=UPI003B7E0E47
MKTHFAEVADNTNRYATAKFAYTGTEAFDEFDEPVEDASYQRVWVPTSAEEIKVWIGINLYMAFLNREDPRTCWNASTGVSDIYHHMSLKRYEQIRRFFHIYGPSEDESHLPTAEQSPWFYKFEPLSEMLRILCHQYLRPGTFGAIDECMAKFNGRSFQTTHMERKPIQDGYKIVSLAFAGYIRDWVWWSGNGDLPGPSIYNSYYQECHGFSSRSELAVLALTHTLDSERPNEERPFVMVMDNAYTSIKLFSFLRTIRLFGALGTVRFSENGRNSDIPKSIQRLKDGKPASRDGWSHFITVNGRRRKNPIPPPELTAKEKLQLQWGWIEQAIIRQVLCWGWQDNAIVTGMSTIHEPVTLLRHLIVHLRKKPFNARPPVKEVFGEYSCRELPIPWIIQHYNMFMNGVDRADQSRKYMTTHKRGWRNWMPIFWWLLDTMACNGYFLYCLHAEELGIKDAPRVPQTQYQLGMPDGPPKSQHQHSHREWMHHVALGLIVDGYSKLHGHVAEDCEIMDVSAIIQRGKQRNRSKSTITITHKLLSKQSLPLQRFERPLWLHGLVPSQKRSYCLWCRYLHSGTRRPSVKKPLREVDMAGPSDAGNIRTGKKLVVEMDRVSRTRLVCSYCDDAPLCKGRCFVDFHSKQNQDVL